MDYFKFVPLLISKVIKKYIPILSLFIYILFRIPTYIIMFLPDVYFYKKYFFNNK